MPSLFSMHSSGKATLVGLLALLLWSTVAGLIRGVSESFGATGGAALIYTLAAALLAVSGSAAPKSPMPRRFLVIGGALFASYEVCLSLSLGYATHPRQAVEVSMVHYLWPTFMLVGDLAIHQRRANLLILPGIAAAVFGIAWILGDGRALDLQGMLDNVRVNPWAYGLSLAAALCWATYCLVTPRMANGHSGVTVFFVLTAAVLWVKWTLQAPVPMTATPAGLAQLAAAGVAMAFGYRFWHIALLHGRPAVLAASSYLAPVFSAAFVALLFRTALPASFWQGATLVCLGSILCRLATLEPARARSGGRE